MKPSLPIGGGLIKVTYLEEAGGGGGVNLDVGGVGVWQLLSVPEPDNGGPRVGKDLTGDVGRVSLPGVDCD